MLRVLFRETHLLIERFAEILKIEFIFAHKQVAYFFGDYAIFVQFIGYSRPFFVSGRIKKRLYFLAHGYNHGRHIYTCLPCGKYPMRAGQSLISIVPVLNKHNIAAIVPVVLKLVYEVMVFAAACNSVGRRYLHRIDFSDICIDIFRRKLDIFTVRGYYIRESISMRGSLLAPYLGFLFWKLKRVGDVFFYVYNII